MTKFTLKTPKEVEMMAQGGEKLARVRDEVARAVKPGVTSSMLDKLADRLIAKAGGQPSFKVVPGYSWATCINVNETVVHGIPDDRELKEGDVVGIDVGMYYLGFHTDTSVTVGVGKVDPKTQKFLDTGRGALKKAIELARPDKKIADLSEAMQTTVEAAGYSAVRALTGHGVGRELHEEPAIPCFVMEDRRYSPKIVPGMVLAIEVMYNQGTYEVVHKNRDGWTIITADGKISGLFEETVAVTENGPMILTK